MHIPSLSTIAVMATTHACAAIERRRLAASIRRAVRLFRALDVALEAGDRREAERLLARGSKAASRIPRLARQSRLVGTRPAEPHPTERHAPLQNKEAEALASDRRRWSSV